MTPRRMKVAAALLLCAAGAIALAARPPRPKRRRLPAVNLKQPIIWGAECVLPDGTGLAFGGQDRNADDGRPHTRVRAGDAWRPIVADLRAADPLQRLHGRAWAVRMDVKNAAARARYLYFQGRAPDEQARQVKEELRPALARIAKALDALTEELGNLNQLKAYETGQVNYALGLLRAGGEKVKSVEGGLTAGATPEAIKTLSAVQIGLERAAEALDAEPPPRALSPIVYDAKTKLFVLFGGDHLDYLTNDTWVFDPAERKWRQRRPASAPPPRARHQLTTAGNGKVVLSGGYNYTSSTDYCGAQYQDIDGAEWTYDIAADAWAGAGRGQPPDSRAYRTGPYHPDFFLRGQKPNAAAVEARLKDLPANTWVDMNPPHRPRLDRVWGTSILDPDRDVILVWCGGHSSHGGSDVLHYHIATNRWELPFPVEFPLGQLYSNTSYPDSFNLNRRPWPTGHTYRSYGYDPVLRKMLFVGHHTHCYVYDPHVADWTGRSAKPKQMTYGGCFYDLTCCPTPQGLTAWGGYYGRRAYSKISRFDAAKREWIELPLKGDTLPGSRCDRCCMVYDSKRDRLLCFTQVAKVKGTEVVAVDLKTFQVKMLSPAGMTAAGDIGFLREFCYVPEHDLVVGTTLSTGQEGVFRTPAYDCDANRWVSLKIAGPNPSGKGGRNVSLGLIYDPKRKLIWGVDNYHLRPYVLRLDPETADLKPLP